jgi:pilus assembly protein CpaF
MNNFLSYYDTPATPQQTLSTQEREALANQVIDQINREFPASILQRPSPEDRSRIRERIAALVAAGYQRRNLAADIREENALTDDLTRRLTGLGFLDLLLPPARTDLSEIAMYSSGLLQVMKKGSVRWETVEMRPEPEEIWRVLDRLLGPQNKSLNETNPSVNARLPATPANPGGGRIKALHPVIAPPGRNPVINIRLYEQKPVRPEWILERGVVNEAMLAFLSQSVQNGARILICGGTRTGKTTLLSALCNFLPQGWRIVKIEDPEEIWIDRQTVQTLEARPQAIGTEVQPYTLANGVDDALRLSPDYLIVGEVRDGQAAMALFRAMMTGHSGACTFHADHPEEAVERMATILGTDQRVGREAALQMIGSSVDLLVQIGIRQEVRRVTSISTIVPGRYSEALQFRHLYQFLDDSPADQPLWKKC